MFSEFNVVKSDPVAIPLNSQEQCDSGTRKLSLTLQTYGKAIELSALGCYHRNPGQYNLTLRIEPIDSTQGNSTTLTRTVDQPLEDMVLVSSEENPVVFNAYTRNRITLSSEEDFVVCRHNARKFIVHDIISGEYAPYIVPQHYSIVQYGSFISYFVYRTVDFFF